MTCTYVFSDPVISDNVIALFTLALGAYALRRGWKLVKHPTRTAPPLADKIAVWLRLIFEGEQAAKKLREEITKPAQLRQSGIYTLIVGGILFVSGAGQLVMGLLRAGG